MPRLSTKDNVSPRKKVNPIKVTKSLPCIDISDIPDKAVLEKILRKYSSDWKRLAQL
jgi:hypothetical protein